MYKVFITKDEISIFHSDNKKEVYKAFSSTEEIYSADNLHEALKIKLLYRIDPSILFAEEVKKWVLH